MSIIKKELNKSSEIECNIKLYLNLNSLNNKNNKYLKM